MCDGCPLQTLADVHPHTCTRVTIWHEREGQPDRVQVAVIRDGNDSLDGSGETCREAVADLLQQMDARLADTSGWSVVAEREAGDETKD